jgi:hypothetical protein
MSESRVTYRQRKREREIQSNLHVSCQLTNEEFKVKPHFHNDIMLCTTKEFTEVLSLLPLQLPKIYLHKFGLAYTYMHPSCRSYTTKLFYKRSRWLALKV